MKHSKSGLFLMELIIVLLFFSLASTICIRLFVKSHALSQETVDLTNAVTLAQNLAENFIASDGDPNVMQENFPKLTAAEENILLLIENGYCSQIRFSLNENGLRQGDIEIYPKDKTERIYSLQVLRYVPEGRTANE